MLIHVQVFLLVSEKDKRVIILPQTEWTQNPWLAKMVWVGNHDGSCGWEIMIARVAVGGNWGYHQVMTVEPSHMSPEHGGLFDSIQFIEDDLK